MVGGVGGFSYLGIIYHDNALWKTEMQAKSCSTRNVLHSDLHPTFNSPWISESNKAGLVDRYVSYRLLSDGQSWGPASEAHMERKVPMAPG